MFKKVAIGASFVIGACGGPSAVLAQTVEENVQRIDTRLNALDRASDIADRQGERFGPSDEQEKPKPFTFKITLPFSYLSNVENADTGKKSAAHFAPAARLIWQSTTTGPVKPFAFVNIDSDFLTKHHENDSSSLTARFGLKVIDKGALGDFVPYAHYTPVLAFERGFKNHQVTLHNLAVGVVGNFELRKSELEVDVQFLRREATLSGSEQNRLTARVGLSGNISERLSWSLEQTVQGRYFTAGANDGRKDLNLNSNAGLSFALGDNGSLDLGINFERNNSNRAGRDYSTWDIGPSAGFLWKF